MAYFFLQEYKLHYSFLGCQVNIGGDNDFRVRLTDILKVSPSNRFLVSEISENKLHCYIHHISSNSSLNSTKYISVEEF